MPDVILYGPFLDEALCREVFGREVELRSVTLEDYEVIPVDAPASAALRRRPGSRATVGLASGLSDDDTARLDHFAAALSMLPVPLDLSGAGLGMVCVHLPSSGEPSGPASPPAGDRALLAALARDVMALRGRRSPADIAARLEPMRVRAASRLRAAGGPAELRHPMTVTDLRVADQRQPYAHYFAVEEYDLAWRRFDGSHSATVNRAVFISGDAVTVLPYDPVRDRVLLIEQFRAGPFARGDAQPWQLEAIAGRIDPGETPEQAARREAEEEAGLALGELLPVAGYYPSPGAKSEFLYSYVALADLPDGTAGIFGLEEEAEDIRGHLVGFDRLMQLVESGEAANAPLVLTAFWLQRERGRLRG